MPAIDTVTPAVTALSAALGVDDLTAYDLLRVTTEPDHARWREQVTRTGGCADPVLLTGHTTTVDRATGQVLHAYSTDREPGGVLRIACGNRRASRCPSCSFLYAGDTFHLIRAGLTGGKHVPDHVRAHPRVFATLTAPSFGSVHNRPDAGRCACGTRHTEDAPELGTPLDPWTYDYGTAVLWNNHASQLWARFTVYLRREIARRVGLTGKEFKAQARVSFAKVAEFQRRGAVHFHAVIRLDGPDDTGNFAEPPPWASVGLLDRAIRAAAARVRLDLDPVPEHDQPARILRWGTQIDVRPITGDAFTDPDSVTEQGVAAYVAKYATKSAEAAGVLDRRIVERAEIAWYDLPDHARRLVQACWDLDDAYPDRKLAHWSHMLGFRGHFSTKSRAYSTTLGALRQVRADYRAAQQREALGLPDDLDDTEPTTLVLAHWAYAGHGHTPGESFIAASIARERQLNRALAREALADLEQEERS